MCWFCMPGFSCTEIAQELGKASVPDKGPESSVSSKKVPKKEADTNQPTSFPNRPPGRRAGW